MPELLDLPKDQAGVDSICVRPDYSERQVLDQVYISPEQGAEGDRWKEKTWVHLPDGSSDPRVQLALTNTRFIRFISNTGQDMNLHGDTFMVDIDFSEANMPVGQRLQIGEAVIEVSDVYNDSCNKFIERYGKDVVKWINHPPYKSLRLRGIFAKVIKAGLIRRGDKVTRL